MAGHSKWANIKHRKGAQDAKRAKVFNRLIKELTVASKESGPDPETNPRLRTAIQNAKGANMPKDTIEKAINKGQGIDSQNYDELSYEGYGPGGIAIYIEATTDNINRTVSNIRAIFTKAGGSLGKNGSIDYMFERKGVFRIDLSEIKMNRDDFIIELIDAGAEEVEFSEGNMHVYSSFEGFGSMQQKLEGLKVDCKSAELQRIPLTTVSVDVQTAKKVLALLDKFEEDDDVNQVFHNLEMTEEIEKELYA